MSTATSPFLFRPDVAVKPPREAGFVARLPAGIEGTPALFRSIAQVLRFPDYFGKNWNAVNDCLTDFDWIEKRDIWLIHEDLPRLETEDDLALYIHVLRDAVEDWQRGGPHRFQVLFPGESRDLVERLAARPRPY